MDSFLTNLKDIRDIDSAIAELKLRIEFTPKLELALAFCIEAHKNQFRKSGEPYVVHPILVAAITAYFSNDETMVVSALLHDVVEDTDYNLEHIKSQYGEDTAHIVDGLTKIVEIREHEFSSSNSDTKQLASSLSFRKMLIASIDDVRVLVVKLCDRVHNMLTLDAFVSEKQKRIAEETLVVYAPIAHRLGISIIKNTLEDLAFYYLYPDEYKRIDEYIENYQQKIQLNFNHFVSQTKDTLHKMGYDSKKIQILSRIKHHYSIYLKMQRKGINIDEVLDLLAIRILVEDELDCYRVLGLMHIEHKPLIARFKDYIATPKENGYKTIHTTIFYDSKIYEVQIRTFNMHDIAEYGVAAHWKYKGSPQSSTAVNLDWLHALEHNNDDIEEFVSDAKQDLYSEDIVVYSPRGDIFTFPRGATSFDFAYEIHTDVGNKALQAIINKIKRPLLTELKSGDIVSIETGKKDIPRCSWLDMVITSKSKKSIKHLCSQRLNEIDELSGRNIINTIFSRYDYTIANDIDIHQFKKVSYVLDYLKNMKRGIEKKIKEKSLLDRLKVQKLTFKTYTIDNIVINSNFSINSVLFDHCCHPKFGDEIVAFKDDKTAMIHHKLCDSAYEKICANEQMLFCGWVEDKFYTYKMVVSLPNTRGELARLLTHIAKYEGTILFIEYGKDKYAQNQYCAIDFEISNQNIDEVKKIVEQKAKVIEFYSARDAYK